MGLRAVFAVTVIDPAAPFTPALGGLPVAPAFGLGLALFLPVHFYVLAFALNQPERLDGFLRFADNPLVKVAEFGLVFLLAVHVFGGLRLLALEFLPWSPRHKTMAASAVAARLPGGGHLFSCRRYEHEQARKLDRLTTPIS